ncbi:hypothetical protein GWK90_06365 [Candidatus Hamiltonella defensa]|uniref:hypothetical protein n=1 Tax=Candidatus Williamhamiltonella defendens TaxID=138072 RepID=UPI000D5FEFED|nr:hypothetical protein [Candidatus Hamiltonella defensa]AWK15846.1 hypothetical protein CCS40_00670 [Candidatus Hamiltonella defensa]MBK4361872.1 hypothetical protein [Candidatus Hamiltonella defensa]
MPKSTVSNMNLKFFTFLKSQDSSKQKGASAISKKKLTAKNTDKGIFSQNKADQVKLNGEPQSNTDKSRLSFDVDLIQVNLFKELNKYINDLDINDERKTVRQNNVKDRFKDFVTITDSNKVAWSQNKQPKDLSELKKIIGEALESCGFFKSSLRTILNSVNKQIKFAESNLTSYTYTKNSGDSNDAEKTPEVPAFSTDTITQDTTQNTISIISPATQENKLVSSEDNQNNTPDSQSDDSTNNNLFNEDDKVNHNLVTQPAENPLNEETIVKEHDQLLRILNEYANMSTKSPIKKWGNGDSHVKSLEDILGNDWIKIERNNFEEKIKWKKNPDINDICFIVNALLEKHPKKESQLNQLLVHFQSEFSKRHPELNINSNRLLQVLNQYGKDKDHQEKLHKKLDEYNDFLKKTKDTQNPYKWNEEPTEEKIDAILKKLLENSMDHESSLRKLLAQRFPEKTTAIITDLTDLKTKEIFKKHKKILQEEISKFDTDDLNSFGELEQFSKKIDQVQADRVKEFNKEIKGFWDKTKIKINDSLKKDCESKLKNCKQTLSFSDIVDKILDKKDYFIFNSTKKTNKKEIEKNGNKINEKVTQISNLDIPKEVKKECINKITSMALKRLDLINNSLPREETFWKSFSAAMTSTFTRIGLVAGIGTTVILLLASIGAVPAVIIGGAIVGFIVFGNVLKELKNSSKKQEKLQEVIESYSNEREKIKEIQKKHGISIHQAESKANQNSERPYKQNDSFDLSSNSRVV